MEARQQQVAPAGLPGRVRIEAGEQPVKRCKHALAIIELYREALGAGRDRFDGGVVGTRERRAKALDAGRIETGGYVFIEIKRVKDE
jgi:hypothetical protein